MRRLPEKRRIDDGLDGFRFDAAAAGLEFRDDECCFSASFFKGWQSTTVHPDDLMASRASFLGYVFQGIGKESVSHGQEALDFDEFCLIEQRRRDQ